MSHKAAFAAAKQRADKRDELLHIREIEERPPEHDEDEHVKIREDSGKLFDVLPEEQLFDHDQQAEIQPPQGKVPACAVPQACQAPNDRCIDEGPYYALPVAAKRDVNVFLEPGAEGDMPSAPKFGNAF